ncbi:outer membrane beta-barrel family protein [Niabella ginsengisoli]|uniref:Outer membrane beta-barrel family protein n=1 Tax=Niabella ginsengisoli TaxID=522298 RepID=A0ABS9SEY7_9BACT|nr:outer membrane beta-barrel family protein [Niabella ginsengisoli]MCH5596921.1 outer membrane beta-barrel family protein [Niabella ginsengisoli]
MYGTDKALRSILASQGNNSGRSKNININGNYKHTFDSLGKEMTTDLDYGYYDDQGKNLLITRALDVDNTQVGNTISLRGTQPSIVNIYSGKVDYIHPFSKALKLEAGIKSSYVNTDNNVRYMRDTSTGWFDDIERSNHFIFKENINALYGIFTASLKKWELSAGLRVENTNAKGEQVEIDSSFTRKYTNLFPNVGAVYSINDKNKLSFAYSRRVRRPDYDDLNPFVYFIDSLTYGQGNPYLQPEFSNRFELSHTYRSFLTLTISHTRTDDIITQLLKQNTEKKTTFQTTENFAKRRQWGASVSINKQLVKWWNLSLYTGVFNNQYKGLYNDGKINTPIEVEINVLDANVTNSFSFAKIWTGEISGWFSSSPSDGLIIGNPMGALNVALAKQVFKKKELLRLEPEIFCVQATSADIRDMLM